MSFLGPKKLTLKLFADPKHVPPMAAFIEVFHTWIKRHVLDEPMIDVTDYGHVHDGPKVFFCGHESDYAIDWADGRVGILYRRKRAPEPKALPVGQDAILGDGLSRLLVVAAKLEKEPTLAGLSFARSELSIGLTDRLRAPNDDATFERVAPIVSATLASALGAVSLSRDSRDSRRPLTLTAKSR